MLKNLKHDVKAGLAVAAISLPIGVAYSELLGLPPESGIYTAVFALICYAIIGSSKELIIGPDSASVALLASSVFEFGKIQGATPLKIITVITILSGIIFFIAGFIKLGYIANFLSTPILMGFLNGVAAVLVISQITKFTGVKIEDNSSIFGLYEFLLSITSVHLPTLILGIISLVSIQIIKLYSKRIPASLIIILIVTVCAAVFGFSRFGILFSPEIKSGIPIPEIPEFGLFKNHYEKFIGDACAIVLLTYANTVLIGKTFSCDKYLYNPDREFYAMGISNLTTGLFKGFTSSGSTSRTVINIDSGSKSKMSMIFGALLMVVVILIFPKEFSLIPAVVFAAVIIDSAAGIFNFKKLMEIRDTSKDEFFVAIICMLGVMIIGVLYGIVIALILSFLILIKKSSYPIESEIVYNKEHETSEILKDENQFLRDDDSFIYRFNSPMLFYNFDYFRKRIIERTQERNDLKLIIIDASPVNYIDFTFRNELSSLIKDVNQRNIRLFFVNANAGFEKSMRACLLKNKSETEIFFTDIGSALNYHESKSN